MPAEEVAEPGGRAGAGPMSGRRRRRVPGRLAGGAGITGLLRRCISSSPGSFGDPRPRPRPAPSPAAAALGSDPRTPAVPWGCPRARRRASRPSSGGGRGRVVQEISQAGDLAAQLARRHRDARARGAARDQVLVGELLRRPEHAQDRRACAPPEGRERPDDRTSATAFRKRRVERGASGMSLFQPCASTKRSVTPVVASSERRAAGLGRIVDAAPSLLNCTSK